ncbi:hypothetical protein AAF712_007616 [Marasmius tenuissimus]|uniref:FBD domain-containing protein n=1 Tax=Marasmius tenuissimus TaxID=585030 RepID=A0ABR2ZWI7_9AGAR
MGRFNQPLLLRFSGLGFETFVWRLIISGVLIPATPTFDPIVVNTFRSVILLNLVSLSINFPIPRAPYRDGDDPNTFAIDKLPIEDLLQDSQSLTHFELVSPPRIFSAETISRVLRPLKTLKVLSLGHETLGGQAPERVLNIASSWRRAWLERILQELLPPDPADVTIESQYGRSPVCPRLEKFSVGCLPNETDILLNFATKKPNLTVIRADFGQANTTETRHFLESEVVKARALQEARGIVIEWK